MYYRVGAFYKDENRKEIMVQVPNRASAEAMVPQVKQILFPGEDIENYPVRIFEFKLQVNLNRLNHYRITVYRPAERIYTDEQEEMLYESAEAFDEVVEADTEEEAKATFLRDYFESYAVGRSPDEYELYVDEVPLSELIKGEEERLLGRIVNGYMREKYGHLPLREYARLMRAQDSGQSDEIRYEALQAFSRALSITEYMEKKLDTASLTYNEFCVIRNQLRAAKTGEDFCRINLEIMERYGRKGR